MLLGFFNGLIVSLFIFLKIKSNTFLKIAALAVFLFSLTILREFLSVFGDEIELNYFLKKFLYFKLLVVGIIIIAYDKSSSKPTKKNYHLLIPGIVEFLVLSLISLKWIVLPHAIEDSCFIAVDCISFFWILYAFNQRKGKEKKLRHNLKFLFFFVLGFGLVFFTRVIQFFAIILESNGLYNFHFLLRIMAIGIIVYTISIKLIIAYSKHRNRVSRNDSTIKPKSKKLLNQIQGDQKYLNQNITLEKLASYYEIDSKTLSATIRKHNDSNFNDYVNSLRLDHFMFLIENLEHKKYTLFALAEKSGFNSKATFNRVFKKQYLIPPSSYIEQNY